jgi:hypothetical protein
MADESPELKAGHAPATKVGGRRVVQNKSPKEEEDKDKKMTPEEVEEFGEDKPEKKSTGPVMISGANASVEAAFPPEAVKAMHEKPMPTHDKGASQKPKIIQQPRK